MSRRLKLITPEMGTLELYFIYQYGDEYEPDWRPLQGHPLTSLLPVISKADADHALCGFTRPMVKQLGLAPAHCLVKIAPENRGCAFREDCLFYKEKDCQPTSKKLPNCYQPGGVSEQAAHRARELVALWREGVWVLVIREETLA